ncbi:hypothetical protein [Moraxella bovoculi]|nr:hypothetical protein [Moraxella bovoculi]
MLYEFGDGFVFWEGDKGKSATDLYSDDGDKDTDYLLFNTHESS